MDHHVARQNRPQESDVGANNPDAMPADWEDMRWIFQLAPHLLAYHRFYSTELSTGDTNPENYEQLNQRRQLFVGETLLHKKVVAENKRKSCNNPDEDSTTPPPPHRLKSDLVLAELDSSSHTTDVEDPERQQRTDRTCPICLKEYEVDEEICWSPNNQCNHSFHRECIVQWLLRHEECPCCRQNYLDSSRVPPVSSEDISYVLQDSDFLGMLASIERMYRETNVRFFYQHGVFGRQLGTATPENTPISGSEEQQQDSQHESGARGEASQPRPYSASMLNGPSDNSEVANDGSSSDEPPVNDLEIDLEQEDIVEGSSAG